MTKKIVSYIVISCFIAGCFFIYFSNNKRSEVPSHTQLKGVSCNIWSYQKIKRINGIELKAFLEYDLKANDNLIFENGVEIKITENSDIFINNRKINKNVINVFIEINGEIIDHSFINVFERSK